MLRIGLGPLVGLCGEALTLLALARAFPLRIGVDLESDRPRSVSIVVFPGERGSVQPMPQQVLAANVQRTLARNLQPRVRALALELGTEPGRVSVRAIRIGRTLRWAAWSGAELAEWKPKAGIDRAVTTGGELELELSGVEPARLAHVAVAAALKAGERREQTMVLLAGALLGVAVALRPALRAWRLGSSTQRKLAVAYPGLGIVLVGLSAVAGKRVLARGKRSGYQDPTGDYDFSFLDHFGRRVSRQIGQLGLVLDPFSFYRNYPGQRNASLSVDENGFRGGIPQHEKPLAFLLGGSTVFGYGLSSDDQTIGARMNEYLPGHAVVNAGVSGFASGQELVSMLDHADSWRPGIYIVLDGWNDLLEAVYHPRVHPVLAGLPILAVNDQYFWMEQNLSDHARSTYEGELPSWTAPSLLKSRSMEERFQEALDRYVTNVERMATWARARGAVFLVVLQPEKGAKRDLTKSERAAPTASAELSASYRRFVEAAMQRFAALDIPHASLLDHPAIVDSSEALFTDPFHLTPAGCNLVARLLAEHVSALLASSSSLRTQ